MKKHFFAFVYFLFAIILFIFARIDEKTLDIANHDIYFVIQYEHLWKLLSLYFFVLSAITFGLKFFKVSLSKIWLHLHIWISFIVFFAINFILNTIKKNSQPKRYYDYSVYEDFKTTKNSFDVNEVLLILIPLFTVVQVFYFISILVGYLQQRKHGKANT